MTIEQILIMVFGSASVSLLTAIYFRLGGLQVAHEHFEKQIEKLWSAVSDLRKEYAK